ncbi:hypothetical protein C8Q77DRAFT_220100 [Trametes polyzona]|nr:hypothetical protein C8Q77DRAFT_220100 [Trametes polyzona]
MPLEQRSRRPCTQGSRCTHSQCPGFAHVTNAPRTFRLRVPPYFSALTLMTVSKYPARKPVTLHSPHRYYILALSLPTPHVPAPAPRRSRTSTAAYQDRSHAYRLTLILRPRAPAPAPWLASKLASSVDSCLSPPPTSRSHPTAHARAHYCMSASRQRVRLGTECVAERVPPVPRPRERVADPRPPLFNSARHRSSVLTYSRPATTMTSRHGTKQFRHSAFEHDESERESE